ncbi:uncharacterized protein LOC110260612 [Sus scrofa]|uniref:uncharacterized protein LOC110260612 n=1 Tax=Sus scrofa TaxID=9823 RepID=UPI000A2B11B8|nr:uncharacterized protein LOC110260612 [Sus scrofa]
MQTSPPSHTRLKTRTPDLAWTRSLSAAGPTPDPDSRTPAHVGPAAGYARRRWRPQDPDLTPPGRVLALRRPCSGFGGCLEEAREASQVPELVRDPSDPLPRPTRPTRPSRPGCGCAAQPMDPRRPPRPRGLLSPGGRGPVGTAAASQGGSPLAAPLCRAPGDRSRRGEVGSALFFSLCSAFLWDSCR